MGRPKAVPTTLPRLSPTQRRALVNLWSLELGLGSLHLHRWMIESGRSGRTLRRLRAVGYLEKAPGFDDWEDAPVQLTQAGRLRAAHECVDR